MITLEKAVDGGRLLGVHFHGLGTLLMADLTCARPGSLLPLWREHPGLLSTSQSVSMAKQLSLSKPASITP